MIKINKRRKTINGVTITLFEKERATIVEEPLQEYINIEGVQSQLESYIEDKLANIEFPEQLETVLTSTTPAAYLSGLSGYETDGAFLTSEGGDVRWEELNESKLAKDIEHLDTITQNYQARFESSHVFSERHHIRFASKPSIDGIFWANQYDAVTDFYSIKVGANDAPTGIESFHSGYSYGGVSGLAMRFGMGPHNIDHRGFIWTAINADPFDSTPVMALDLGGNLKVKDTIIIDEGYLKIDDWSGQTGLFAPIIASGISATTTTGDVLTVRDILVAASGERTALIDLVPNLKTKSMTLLDPTSSEDITLWKTPRSTIIKEINTVVFGVSSPTVAWSVRFNEDRNDTGYFVKASTASGTTTGDTFTTFTFDEIPSDNWVWLETSSTGGTSVSQVHLTIVYLEL